MKSIIEYIREANEDEDEKKSEDVDNKNAEKDDNENEDKVVERGDIKFMIWLSPDKKVNWLNDNEDYLKIEYKHQDREKNIFIDFLLGYVEQEQMWKLWTGKIGALSYDDDPYCKLDSDKFSEAILNIFVNKSNDSLYILSSFLYI